MNNKADILNELKEIAPLLFSYKEKDGLPEVPAGYFKNLTATALYKIAIHEELKDISPVVAVLKLNEIKPVVPANYFQQFSDIIIPTAQEDNKVLSLFNKNVEAPVGYFDSLADNILEKIKKEETLIAEGKIIPLHSQRGKIIRIFSRVAIAASLAGVIFWGVKHQHQTVTPVNDCEDGIACLTQDEIYNYMTEHSHEFSVQQIQETVRPAIENSEPKIEIDKKEATDYIEKNKVVLDVDDESTDIF